MDGNGCSIGTHILSYKPEAALNRLDEYERLSSCPASKIGVYCGYIHKYADWQFAANAQLRLRRSA